MKVGSWIGFSCVFDEIRYRIRTPNLALVCYLLGLFTHLPHQIMTKTVWGGWARCGLPVGIRMYWPMGQIPTTLFKIKSSKMKFLF